MKYQNFDEEIESLDIEPVTENPNIMNDYSNTIGTSVGIDPTHISNIDLSKKEEIGFLPPRLEIKKKKGNILKIFVTIIIVIVSIFLVGFGVYYYLSLANSKAKNRVIPKDLVYEKGVSLSNNPADYATYNGISSTNCYVNTKSVDINKSGNYTYQVVCGNDTYNGSITISDSEAPKVTVKTVNKKVNDSIKAEEFIVECIDDTLCTYAFMDEKMVLNSMLTPGSYTVKLKVSDSSSNSVYIDAILNVSSSDIAYYLECKSPMSMPDDTYAIVTSDTFFFNFSDLYLNVANRTVNFLYLDSSAYQSAKQENTDSVFKNQTGNVTYQDDKYTVLVQMAITKEMLNNTEFTSLEQIQDYYKSMSYTCMKKTS